MKRIQSACLNQTIHFQMKEEMEHELAVSEVRAEYEQYRKTLDKKRVKYQIVAVLAWPDILVLVVFALLANPVMNTVASALAAMQKFFDRRKAKKA